jgi:transposase
MQIAPQNREQQLFFTSIDDFVSQDNPVRIIDALINAIIFKNPDKYIYKGLSYTGRPAFMTETLLKIYIYGYLNRITSSRRLEIETKRNMELIWLTGNLHPDFKTIADFRKDNKDIINEFCKDIKYFLKSNGLIDLKCVAFDGTKLKANASKDMTNRKNILASLQLLESELEQYLVQMDEQDSIESRSDLYYHSTENDSMIAMLEQEITELKSQLSKINESGKNYISQNDNDCNKMKSRDGMIPGYNVQIGSDTKHHFIVNEYITDAANDIGQLSIAVDSLEEELQQVPEVILADTGYGNPDMIQKIEETQETQCFIPFAKEHGKSIEINFTFEPENDRYICSQGQYLTLKHKNKVARKSFVDVYTGQNCHNCPLRGQCTDSKTGRQISRYWNHDFRQAHREKMDTADAKRMSKKRKSVIEHIMGTMKVWLGKIPLLTTGFESVTSEIKLFSASYNIKRLLSLISFENIKEMIENYINPDISKNESGYFLYLKNIINFCFNLICSIFLRYKIVYQG